MLFFFVLAIYKWVNGLWLYQVDPQFYNTRFDGFTWLFMQTKLHEIIIANKWLQGVLDLLFYTWPIVYYAAYRVKKYWALPLGLVWIIINWTYVESYTLFHSNSIEAHIAWLLFPILFCIIHIKSFYYALRGLSYFFLFFFVSAALWKVRQGGLFNIDQMSGILLAQHKEFLIQESSHWYSTFIYWLVANTYVSYSLYALATALEFAFIVGYFTRKYNGWLIVATLLFLASDYFVMRIPYFEILPFTLTLWYSMQQLEES